jgi:hypothetical protein
VAPALRMSSVRTAPGAAAFANTWLEWRLLAETGGTFFLVLGAAGGSGPRVDLHRGPLAGALLAVALARALRGPPSPAADLAAQGAVIYPGEGHDRF